MIIEIRPPLSIYELGQRDNQEDALWPKEASADSRIFILCDGMGGYENGEVASQIVSQAIGKWLLEHTNPENPLEDEQLVAALEASYRELDKYTDGNLHQMGTTLTLLYIHRHGITSMHMGDSRIYHFRPNKGLLFQSRDHSLAFDLFQAGEITYEEMINYPQKNIISRAITPGENNRMRPDIIHITDIEPYDWFIMCSDGMLEKLSNSDIIEILNQETTDEEIKNNLVKITSRNSDNHSAWLIRIKDVLKENNDKSLINEELTSRCNALNFLPKNTDDDVIIVSKSLLNKLKGFLEKIRIQYARKYK